MSVFPKTYHLVREGSLQAVAVDNYENLLPLRTELELLYRFSHGHGPEVVAAIERKLALLKGQDSYVNAKSADRLEDMLTILRHARAPENLTAIAQIDSEFPEIKAGMSMDSIEKETEQFQQEVAEQSSDQQPVDEVAPDAQVTDQIVEQVAEPQAQSPDQPAIESDPIAEDEPAPDAIEATVDDVDVESLVEAFSEAEGALNEITSALDDATADLGAIGNDISEVIRPVDEAAPDDLQAPPTDAISPPPEPVPQIADVVAPPTIKTVPVSPTGRVSPTGDLRGELQRIKNTIAAELDQVSNLLNNIDQQHQAAEARLSQAKAFEQAAQQTQAASQQFAAAQNEANAAKTAHDQAQMRAQEARLNWEHAQQQATAAAATST